eukprot:jgi/Mesvir1/24374/Mv11045-RA.1
MTSTMLRTGISSLELLQIILWSFNALMLPSASAIQLRGEIMLEYTSTGQNEVPERDAIASVANAILHGKSQGAQRRSALKYDHDSATIYAKFASIAYCQDTDALLAWQCTWCKESTVQDVRVVDVIQDPLPLQAYVAISRSLRMIIVSFRGTKQSSLANWLKDVQFAKLDFGYPGLQGARVHHGFFAAYNNTILRPRILDAVTRLQAEAPDYTILVVGHSLGAAMTAFCALDMKIYLDAASVLVYNFGMPRVGNDVFAAFFAMMFPDTIRVTHENDVVPHLPPRFSYDVLDYHHVPTEVWLHVDKLTGELLETTCDSSGEDPTCSMSVRGYSVADHETYYDLPMCAGDC